MLYGLEITQLETKISDLDQIRKFVAIFIIPKSFRKYIKVFLYSN